MEPNENKICVSVNVNQRLVKKVELSSSDSIAAAKQKLIDSLGASSRLSKVNLIFGGKVLANDQLVRDLCLSSHSTLHATTEIDAGLGVVRSDNSVTLDQQRRQKEPVYNYYVYCKSCDAVQPGKLRVQCGSCREGGIVLNKGPSNWDDVKLLDRLSGYCLSCAKETTAQFYFKCAIHEGSETAVPLRHVRSNRKHIECITCTLDSPVVIVYPCEGKHVICLECFASYCKISLENRRFVHHAEVGYSLPCPAGCDNSLIKDNHHFCVLGKEKYERYKDFGAEDFLLSTGGIICPNPGCGEGMMLEDSPGSNIRCATCQFVFCKLCLNGRHEGNCVDRGDQNGHDRVTVMDHERRLRSRWDSESLETIQVTTKPCPQCRTRTEKAGGCMHMQCMRCKFEWCWVCEKVWDRDCQGNHWFG